MMTPAKSEEEASPCCEVKLSARGSRLIYPFGEPPRQYDVAIPRTVIYIYININQTQKTGGEHCLRDKIT